MEKMELLNTSSFSGMNPSPNTTAFERDVVTLIMLKIR